MRNDSKWALATFRRLVLTGEWTPARSRMLLMLQDNPGELMGLLAKEMRKPEIAKAMKKLTTGGE
jgi:hypothetical protein